MADGSSFIQQLDQQLEKLLSDWSIYTTIIFVSLVAYLLYPVFFHREPDIHPLLLSRQANVAPVRQPGESAIYRAPDIPYGYPLRSGLNVKDPGAPRWQSGRDGDIRDVWKQAIKGPVDSEGNSSGVPGKIVTILGTEAIVELGFVKLTKEMNALGKHVKDKSGSRVAVYLPNSAEFVVTLFGKEPPFLRPTLLIIDHSFRFLRADPNLDPPRTVQLSTCRYFEEDASRRTGGSSRHHIIDRACDTLFRIEASNMGCGAVQSSH